MIVPPSKKQKLTLGSYLASIRSDRRLTLRQVEELTHNEVSNAYLSQIERDMVPKPSANILGSLADAYRIDHMNLLELAGYVVAPSQSKRSLRRARIAPFAEHNLTADEEAAVHSFLQWYRHQKRTEKS
jgi:transcriptional regulator with XRE-family HTH domain